MNVTEITGRTSLYVSDEAIDFFSMDMVGSAYEALFIH